VASPTAAAGHADSRYRETVGFFSNRRVTLALLDVVGSAETQAEAASAMLHCSRSFATPAAMRTILSAQFSRNFTVLSSSRCRC
jgi:hypothetical protein